MCQVGETHLRNDQHLNVLFKNVLFVFVCLGLVAQLCLTLCNPMDYSLLGSSVRRISQARLQEWVAISFSRESSLPGDRTQVSCVCSIAGRFFMLSLCGKPPPPPFLRMPNISSSLLICILVD